jgi:2,3-bisphosphoglycerate-independent phosphoglycerate mutase
VIGPGGRIRDGDAVVCFNFRADRARQLTRALALDAFDGFARPSRPRLSRYVCMTEYDATFGLPVAFSPQRLTKILGEVLAGAGVKQFRTAETEKYAHVTYFFNGSVEAPFPGEDRLLVPSDREVATYDERPAMSAPAVADVVVERVRAGAHAFVLVNFANPDMVGHTGKLMPAIQAVEVVDACLGRIVDVARPRGAAVLITADHGNCEMMVDPATGQPHTAHTLEPVPLILVDDTRAGAHLAGGRLCDVAPTILAIMGIAQPPEMEGRNLLG